MKKRKLFQNYYSKLLFSSSLLIFILIVIITIVCLAQMNSTRKVSTLENYDSVLTELTKNFNDIWWDYHKALAPIFDIYNTKSIQEFLKQDDAGYEKAEKMRNFERTLKDICQQDVRIAGVYFKDIIDEESYAYFVSEGQLKSASLEFESGDFVQESSRVILGGRVLDQKPLQEVFGIQSQILEIGSEKIQVTVFYDLSSFDAILKKYKVDSDVRFYVTSGQGLIIYDSGSEYRNDQSVFFDKIDAIISDSAVFEKEKIAYIKKTKSMKKRSYLAFYMIPDSSVNSLKFSRVAGIVVGVALFVFVMLVMLLFSINRMISRKFHELEKGMSLVGKNNLDHRLIIGKHDDEFTRIAARFNQMCDDLEDMIDKNYVYQVMQRNAEYMALQTSVNPHFLYNSLEVLRESLAGNDHKDEAEMVLLLSRIFEYQIRGNNFEIIRRELQSLQNYIDFYSIRYKYDFEYSIKFDEEIFRYKVPKHIFQPIMENYFAHGFRNDGSDYILISGYPDTEEDMIRISFVDNGKGMTKEQIDRLTAYLDESVDENAHIGLRNVHKRLKLAFGTDSGIEIVSNSPEPGVSISLVFRKALEIESSDISGHNMA